MVHGRSSDEEQQSRNPLRRLAAMTRARRTSSQFDLENSQNRSCPWSEAGFIDPAGEDRPCRAVDGGGTPVLHASAARGHGQPPAKMPCSKASVLSCDINDTRIVHTSPDWHACESIRGRVVSSRSMQLARPRLPNRPVSSFARVQRRERTVWTRALPMSPF